MCLQRYRGIKMDDLRRKCFFCKDRIDGKKTLEHIVPNSLLGKLGIKEKTITGQFNTIQYSRVKVPAHESCNNQFGSDYENRILSLLENPEQLYNQLLEEAGILMMYSPDSSVSALITTWLSKIYYGLFYYDLISTKAPEWKDVCSSIIQSDNFKLVQSSYKQGYGFQLPSSLYVFKTKNTETDLVTIVEPSTLLLKIGSLTFVLCICDGFLTKNYLNGHPLKKLRSWMEEEEELDPHFPVQKLALAEIIALRKCIPKNPRFVYSKDQIINMSLSTMAKNPDIAYQINEEHLSHVRREVLLEMGIKI
ncbi:TPA: hypothetical protein RQJ52_004311 [Vibrio vulnificus]|nr:hypothetical protein [Vibrio vulnificus]